jgi:hypothetical protein|tara:strand:- start:354 stop:659 length:306 start_codon:yes stop_codon:yes gene_type:complete
MKNTHTTHTHKALGFVVESIREIRKDVTNGERAFADEKLYDLSRTVRSIQREQLPMDLEDARSQSDDDQIRESISDARTTIGTFFQDLRDIYEPKEGNLKL